MFNDKNFRAIIVSIVQKYRMEVNTSVNVDDNYKRKRAITSTSEADTSIVGNSEHNTSVSQDKSKKLKVQTENVDKTDKKKTEKQKEVEESKTIK